MTELSRTILNVDDYGPGRYARTRILEQAGFSVLEATTGRETLKIVAEQKPVLILLDVNLPDMSGFEVCRQIRGKSRAGSPIILHISASNIENSHQVHGLDGGADSYLVEPVDPSVLIATIKAFLRARRAEDALRRSNDELEWFAHRVAHDFAEPLRTITAHTQLLEHGLKGRLDEKQERSFKFVVEAALRMDALMAGLLKFAVVGQGETARKPVDSEAVMARVLANLDAATGNADARVTHDPLPTILADAGLDEVFQNLISNAIKYARPGIPPEVHISAEQEVDHWHFFVKDNGMGIAPDKTKSIFEIFQRLHGRDIPGTGIGLALTQKILAAWGGRIWAESELGTGSTFHFTVPR